MELNKWFLSLSPPGKKERLLDPSLPIDGALPLLIDDLDEDAEGNIFWSDASTIGSLYEIMKEMLGGPSGRRVSSELSIFFMRNWYNFYCTYV